MTKLSRPPAVAPALLLGLALTSAGCGGSGTRGGVASAGRFAVTPAAAYNGETAPLVATGTVAASGASGSIFTFVSGIRTLTLEIPTLRPERFPAGGAVFTLATGPSAPATALYRQEVPASPGNAAIWNATGGTLTVAASGDRLVATLAGATFSPVALPQNPAAGTFALAGSADARP